jgi:hypothetical protein
MPSLCVQSVQDLFVIPFSTLPSGDKNDRSLGEENCTHWISTVASTALAVGFFFTTLGALRISRFTIESFAEKFDAYESASLFDFIANNGLVWALNKIYAECDYQALTLAHISSNAYFGYQSYQESKYHFCALNALFAYKTLMTTDNSPVNRYYGLLKGPIYRFAKSWAPTMAAWYGYRPAPS